ncbi:MAG TPA: DUF1156 domain-containing protein, partial [Planctomycetota bacterium]|nr:DUF1156 domain-containing protein [Planctomycetota bacterium]
QEADARELEADSRLTALWLWTAQVTGERSIAAETPEEKAPKVKGKGFALPFDTARKIAQSLGVHLDDVSGRGGIVEIVGETARLVGVEERRAKLFERGADRPRRTQTSFLPLDPAEAEAIPEVKGVLDRLHQALLLFADGRMAPLTRVITDSRNDARFGRLAQALSALYPPWTEEKRWVDGVIARKKGLGS